MVDFRGYIVLFLVWLVSTILVRSIFRRSKTTSSLPPSPMALPIIGHLHLLAPIPHHALHKLSIRYGPLIHLFLGSVPCVVACSPETAKEILKTHETSFCDRPISVAVNCLTYGSADFSFAPYGPYWKFMKKLCMTQLLGGQTLNQFIPIRSEEIRRFMQFMLKKAKASEAVDVGKELIRLVNNVVSRMTMGQICSNNDKEADEVRKLVQETAELVGKFNLQDYIWFCKNIDLQGFGKRFKEVRRKFDNMMERIIKEHQEARKINKETGKDYAPMDLLDMLLDISEDESSEIKLTRDNIKAFILDIFVAGTDTSAITIEWALAELINHPDMMKKTREEIDSVVGKSRLVEESDIINLPYLQALVKETLRLHPAAPMPVRESTENCTINGHEIPARTRVFINVWAINRDPNHWETPLEFCPERFIAEDGKSQLDVRGQHYHYIPFGSGRRACPGTTLALHMVHSTLAAMIQCFDWEVIGGNGTRVDMEEGTGLTLPMAHPLICVPITRINPFPLS
ncbi:cytochrome P450 93A3-like isoform X2 [Citrus sinensis]|uniref:cytochrome P450 93A3-like isoform X2 n=1 Tax=Citrus sinensis TaxID=2711 RepID=UPI002279E4FC|nr:cytochrome P450 93A3-like isoform X2 [Citrus sinensis]